MTAVIEKELPVLIAQENTQTLVTSQEFPVTVTNVETVTAVTTETGYLVQIEQQIDTVVQGGIQGPRGIPGASTSYETHVAGINIGGHRAVYLDSNNTLQYPDLNDPDSFVVGITTQSGSQGTEVTVQITGTITEAGWNWIPGQNVYVSSFGVLTQTPQVGQRLVVGHSTSPTTIFIDKQPPIYTE